MSYVQPLLEDVDVLIDYACRNSVVPKGMEEQEFSDLVKRILSLKEKMAGAAGSVEDQNEFLMDFRKLGKSLEPVTVKSIRDSTQEDCFAINLPKFKRLKMSRSSVVTSRFTIVSGIVLLLLLALQIYWLVGFQLITSLNSYNPEKEVDAGSVESVASVLADKSKNNIGTGDDGKSKVGDGGKSKVGDDGKSKVGDDGKSKVGDAGKSNPGDGGKSKVGDAGKSKPGDAGKSKVGDEGKSKPGDAGKSKVGDEGMASDGLVLALKSLLPSAAEVNSKETKTFTISPIGSFSTKVESINSEIEQAALLVLLEKWWRFWPWNPSGNAEGGNAEGGNGEGKAFEEKYRFKTISVTSNSLIYILQVYFLPLFYGMMGACTFILRSLTEQARKRLFRSDLMISLWVRVFLGSLAGLAIGWFLQPESEGTKNSLISLAGVGSLTPFALSFVAGYSVELLFTVLDRFVKAFTDESAV